MQKIPNYSQLPDLLVRSLQGLLTTEEESMLSQWRQEDERHEAFFQKISSEKFWKEHPQAQYQKEIVEAWCRLSQQKQKRTRLLRLRRWSIAATIVLCLGGSSYWLFNSSSPTVTSSPTAEQAIIPGTYKAELILSDGARLPLANSKQPIVLPQEGTLIQNDGTSLQYSEKQKNRGNITHTLYIPRGGEYNVTLSDGTQVFLNSESELQYPVNFSGATREVRLSGEAYFKVAHQAQVPFIIKTRGMEVKVLGTEFNLRAYKDENYTATTLVKGKVECNNASGSLILQPGEQGIVDANNQLSKQKVNTEDFTAWHAGMFVFRSQRLEEVMNTLIRWYDIQVFYDSPAQKEVLFSGKVKRFEDFNTLLQMLEAAGSATFTVKGRTVIVGQK